MIDSLSAATDKNGATLRVGDVVRSYDFPKYRLDTYSEGLLEAIGEDVMEGCPRYRILVSIHNRPTEASNSANVPIADLEYERTAPEEPYHIFPPVNGLYIAFSRDYTDGVVKVTP